MKVTLVSQNMAAENINNVENDIFTDTFKQTKPDIYVEFSQEDNRPVDETSIVSSQLMNGYKNVCVQSLSPKQKFNIVTKVYSKSNTVELVDSGKVEINKFSGVITSALESGLGRLVTYATKGSSWVLIKDMSQNILFINMHLPIDTGKLALVQNSSMGNKYRIESMTRCFKTIFKQIENKVNIHTLKIFIGGDLNFRVIDHNDQLSNFLKEDREFSEEVTFPFFELSTNLGSTCKYLTTCDSNRTDKQECLDAKRSPSRCDRMLTNVPLSNLRVLNENNFVINPLLDHNAIIISVELIALQRIGKQGVFAGGKKRKTRRVHRAAKKS